MLLSVPGSSLESCSRSLLAALVLGLDEPDRPLRRIGRRHEFAQCVEDLLELVARVAAEGVVAHGQGVEERNNCKLERIIG